MTCPVCGHTYDESQAAGCATCPLHAGCAMTCCPACGHSTIDPSRSLAARVLAGVRHGVRRARAGRRAPAARLAEVPILAEVPTLADVPPGCRASVIGFAPAGGQRCEQLQAYGLSPGHRVRVLQQTPVTVVQVDHTELALETDVARAVWVRHER
jgi:Fe2+ transport system protein FeoA